MTLKEDAINTMKEELKSITDNSSIEGTLGLINNRRAFAKTEIYRKLRKNELSNEEMYFLLNNYRCGSQEVAEFLVDAISDFTAEKLVAIGGLESILSQSPQRLDSNSKLSNTLINKFKIDNPSKSLNIILEYLTTADRFSSDVMGANNVMISIIGSRFMPYTYRELASERSQPVYSDRDKELLTAIKDNYSLIFNLTSNRQKREERDAIDHERYFRKKNSENISRYISDNYSDEVSEMATLLIETIERCPYIEVDFVIDYINTQAELPKEVQLIILYNLLCSSNLDPILDFDKALEYCENLYKENGISKDLYEILVLATTEGSISSFNKFVERVSNLNGITKERSNAIYEHYFKSRGERNSVTIETLKLKAMINLRVSDLEIAKQVRRLNQIGANTYYITSEFRCDPEKPYSYPGFHTMKEIMIKELTGTLLYARERKDFANMSNKDLIQEFFFKSRRAFNGEIVMTWRMANDPLFIKSLLEEVNHYSHETRSVMEVVNVKNIGFKKYMTILEDVQRNSNENTFFPTDSYYFGYTKNTFTTFDQKALRFATESEINMYKHKIPTNVLLNSSYCTYEVFNYFLNRIENNNVNENMASNVIFEVIGGVRKNEKLTRDQQIDILIRISGKPTMAKFYNINNSEPKTITFNVANSENLTVKDFQNYYSKTREAK